MWVRFLSLYDIIEACSRVYVVVLLEHSAVSRYSNIAWITIDYCPSLEEQYNPYNSGATGGTLIIRAPIVEKRDDLEPLGSESTSRITFLYYFHMAWK